MGRIFSKHKRKFFAVGSALGTAAFMYAIWHSFLALLVTFVVILHELGHYVMANASGAETGYVIFIPIIVGILGVTQITKIPKEAAAKIAVAGPLTGLAAALLLLAAVVLMGTTNYIIPILIIALFEFMNLFVGADAKRYRQGKAQNW